MKYKNFHFTTCQDTGIERVNKEGKTVTCDGYYFQILSDDNCEHQIDDFCGAVGFELPDMSQECADQFAREMIDIQLKEYTRIKDEIESEDIKIEI